nr:NTP transferase domain-containing protein [Psychromicrobium silvestre]
MPESPALAVLAGGKGSRLGGVLKAGLNYQGTPLLARLLSEVWEVSAGSGEATVVVGDAVVLRPLLSGLPGAEAVRWAREDPPFSGPVAALAAALPHLGPGFVLLLASDQPAAAEGVRALLQAAPGPDGVLLQDSEGRDQFLLGLYRVAALRRAVAQVIASGNSSQRLGAVIARLELARVLAPGRSAEDIDEWADAAQWGIEKGQ